MTKDDVLKAIPNLTHSELGAVYRAAYDNMTKVASNTLDAIQEKLKAHGFTIERYSSRNSMSLYSWIGDKAVGKRINVSLNVFSPANEIYFKAYDGAALVAKGTDLDEVINATLTFDPQKEADAIRAYIAEHFPDWRENGSKLEFTDGQATLEMERRDTYWTMRYPGPPVISWCVPLRDWPRVFPTGWSAESFKSLEVKFGHECLVDVHPTSDQTPWVIIGPGGALAFKSDDLSRCRLICDTYHKDSTWLKNVLSPVWFPLTENEQRIAKNALKRLIKKVTKE
jgi:hypothetical protein